MKNPIIFYLFYILFSISSNAKELPWFAASEKQVSKAICRHHEPQSTNEIIEILKSLPNSPENQNIVIEYRGLKFKNTSPQLLNAFVNLSMPQPFDAVAISIDSNENLKQKFNVSNDCENVICASQIIWGDFTGPAMLYLYLRYDLNTSNLSFIQSSPFNEAEMLNILKGLELIPQDLIRLGLNKQITHALRFSQNRQNEVLANASIQFFDLWTKSADHIQQYSLLHEFAHNLARVGTNYRRDRSLAWLTSGHWQNDQNESNTVTTANSKKTKPRIPHDVLSQYALTSAEEDFAESIAAYRLNPFALKKVSLKKYSFIKNNIFSGREFTETSKCNLVEDQFFSNDPSLSDDSLFQIANSCAEWIRIPREQLNISENFYKCAKQQILNVQFQSVVNSDGAPPIHQPNFIFKDEHPNYQNLILRSLDLLKTSFKQLYKKQVNLIINNNLSSFNSCQIVKTGTSDLIKQNYQNRIWNFYELLKLIEQDIFQSCQYENWVELLPDQIQIEKAISASVEKRLRIE